MEKRAPKGQARATQPHTPLLLKYLKAYEERPHSRVFAPLASCYQKMGLIEEAMHVLKKGIKLHPQYPLGYVVLASCYFDLEKYELAYQTLLPFVAQNLDNILMQNIFAQACLKINSWDEALQTYKYLLFLFPKDSFYKKQVQTLEENHTTVVVQLDTSLQKVKEKNAENFFEVFDTTKLESRPLHVPHVQSFVEEEDGPWVTLSLNSSRSVSKVLVPPITATTTPAHLKIVDSQKDLGPSINKEVDEELDKALDKELFIFPKMETEDGPNILKEKEDKNPPNPPKSSAPVMTMTLVDLYVQQGHFAKALVFLESMQKLNPDDAKVIEKIKNVQILFQTTKDENPTDQKQRPSRPILERFSETPNLQKLQVWRQRLQRKTLPKHQSASVLTPPKYTPPLQIHPQHPLALFQHRLKNRAKQKSLAY